MKQKVMIGIIAAVITVAGAGGLFALSKHQEKAQNNQIEQRDTDVYQPLETQSMDQLSTAAVDSTAVVNTKPQTEISVDGIKIVFLGKEVEGVTVTKEQAVKAALEEISKSAMSMEGVSEVKLSYFNSSLEKTYTGSVMPNDKVRYEFKVNAMSGSVYDVYAYERSDINSAVWTRSEKDGEYVNKIISEADMKPFTKITVDFRSNVDCQIVAGDTYSVQADFYGYDYTVGMRDEDGTLTLRSEVNSKENGKKTSTVTVTVPKDQLLDLMSYNSTCGSLTLDGICAKSGNMKLYCGDIEVKNTTIDVFKPVLYCGGLDVNNFLCSSCDAELTCGGANFDSWKQGDLTIDLSCGGLYMEQVEKGTIKAIVACGGAEIHCTGAESEYNYDLGTSLGTNEADGHTAMGDLKKDNHAQSTIIIDNSLGANAIMFNGK